jgi:hypothetical protein
VTAQSFNAVSANPFLVLNDTSGTAAGSVTFQNNGTQKFNLTTIASTNDFALYNNGGTNSYNLYVKHSNGNVGIGTASPKTILQINAGSGAYPTLGTNVTNSIFVGRNDGLIGMYLGYASDGNGWIQQMRNDSVAAANLVLQPVGGNVGIGTASPSEKLVVTQTTNNSSSVGFFTNASTGTSYGPIISAGTNSSDAAFRLFNQGGSASYFQVRGDGLAIMPPLISSFTTGSAANMFVNPGDGAIYRSTSSIKYKKNVEDYDKGLTEVMQMRPVFYEGISESDEGKIFAGLIAEEVNDLGLTEFVQYAEDGSPDSLAYQNMVALLIKSIQELKTEIDSLKNQIK